MRLCRSTPMEQEFQQDSIISVDPQLHPPKPMQLWRKGKVGGTIPAYGRARHSLWPAPGHSGDTGLKVGTASRH